MFLLIKEQFSSFFENVFPGIMCYVCMLMVFWHRPKTMLYIAPECQKAQ